MVEQICAPPSFDKRAFVGEIARMRNALPATCSAAYYVLEPGRPFWVSHNLAAWAGLEAEVRVVNGYASNFPAGYPDFRRTASPSEVEAWTTRHQAPDACYISTW